MLKCSPYHHYRAIICLLYVDLTELCHFLPHHLSTISSEAPPQE